MEYATEVVATETTKPINDNKLKQEFKKLENLSEICGFK